MFVEPESSPTKSALKSDPTASARSTIRRPTVRYQSHTRDHTISSRQRTDGRNSVIHRSSLLDIIRRDHQRNYQREAGEPLDHTATEPLAADIEAATQARNAASNRRRVHDGRALLRDALSYEHPSRRMRQQPGESALRFEVGTNAPSPVPGETIFMRSPFDAQNANQTALHNQGANTMPSPPYTSGDQSARSSLTSSTSPPRSATLTPHFPPAYGHDNLQPERESYVRSSRIRDFRDLPQLDTPHSTHSTSTYGPRIEMVDGLGDRQRSVTPELNHWETLLTTITPDERLPTPDSSFTSANASFNASTFGPSTDANRRASQRNANTARREMIRARIREGRYCDSDSESESGSSNHSPIASPVTRRMLSPPEQAPTDRFDAMTGQPLVRVPVSPTASHPSAHDTASDAEDYIPLTRTSARTAPSAHPHPPTPRTDFSGRRRRPLGPEQQQAMFQLQQRLLRRHFASETTDRANRDHERQQITLEEQNRPLELAQASETMAPPGDEGGVWDAMRQAQRAREQNRELEEQVRTMRDVIERMERGEDGPDWLWANAGLRRGWERL